MNNLYFKNTRTITLTSWEELEESSSDEKNSMTSNFELKEENDEEIDLENLLERINSLNLKLKELKNKVSPLTSEEELDKEYFVSKYSKQLAISKESIETSGIPGSLMFEVNFKITCMMIFLK